jgi:hypothetical protein
MQPHQQLAESRDPAAQKIGVSHPYPLGPAITPGGTNFSVFSANVERAIPR